MSESISKESYSITGLPGAQLTGRFAGVVSGTAPTTGTFLVGDFVIDQTGFTWVCTTAGSPGTWTKTGAPFTGGAINSLTVSGTTNFLSTINTEISGTGTFVSFDESFMTIMGAWL